MALQLELIALAWLKL